MRFGVRCDEITDGLCASVGVAAAAGRLKAVDLDCRGGFDEAGVDKLQRAAGGVHKLVLRF